MATAIFTAMPRRALPAAAVPATATLTRKGWLVRAYDAMIEAQMHRARREVSRYLLTLPQDELNKRGYRTTFRDDAKAPFVG